MIIWNLPVPSAAQSLQLALLGRYESGLFDEGAAEIAAYDPVTQQLYVTNADANSVDIIDVSDPANPVRVNTLDMTPYGDRANSVAVSGGVVAVAVEAAAVDGNGQLIFLTTNGALLNQVPVGVLPDMVTFTPDGTRVLTANEGEPSDDYTIDPEGSVSIIDISGGVGAAAVVNVGFADFNAGGPRAADLPADVRIFGPGATVAQDLEPEYITISDNSATAYVALQENNALAVIDIATATVQSIFSLGFKDHSLAGNALDASNKDDLINIRDWPVMGMYMPDAIAFYRVNGQSYIVTANEGDARDYDGYSEEERIKDLDLDPVIFPDAEFLQENENMGRLKTTTENGDVDGDGDYDELYAYGARSFSIWDATTGALVYDSGDDFERRLATRHPIDFNSNNDENNSFDKRSDDKGPEPEALTIGAVGGRTYAFIGLERMGGILVYDISDPLNVEYVSYTNSRNYSAIFDPDTITPAQLSNFGDSGPEGLVFIEAIDSPTGGDLLVVSNEVSGTVAIYSILEPTPFALTILHNNDGESQLTDLGGDLEDFGGVARFRTLVDQLKDRALVDDGTGTPRGVVMLSSGDNYMAGPEFNVSLDRGVPFFDTQVLDRIGYDAIALGNHDFDFGPDVLDDFISGFSMPVPFLGANISFEQEPDLMDLVNTGRIASSTIIEENGRLIGIIGAITPMLPFISSPRGVEVSERVAESIRAEVDVLEAQGVNIIILISHLQSIQEDLALAPQLTGIDVMIAGGGDELLANPVDVLIPGDERDPDRPYPMIRQNTDGLDIPVVTVPGSYAYVGRLEVTFDADGNVVASQGGPVRVAGGVQPDAVVPDPDLQVMVVDEIVDALAEFDATVIGQSEVALDGRRDIVRTIETNEGNLAADALLWQARILAPDFGVAVPEISLLNSGGIRNNNVISPGDITELMTFDMLPFPSFVTIVPVIPAVQLKQILENAVSEVDLVSGRFAQIAGFQMLWDPDGLAQSLDVDGNVVTRGTRVHEVRLDDGRLVVSGGEVVAGAPTVTIATIDFLARGGDQYPYRGAPFTRLGITYQQSLRNYIVEGLQGTISAMMYPVGGEGRNVELQAGTLSYPDVAPVAVASILTERGGVQVINGGFGSSMAGDPLEEGVFYLLTDRGPNVDGAVDGQKVFPDPGFVPQIGRFALDGGELRLIDIIQLQDADGKLLSGLPNPVATGSSGETPLDLDGNVLTTDPEGLDTEGLVALPDGTFWISDEYGPHIIHVDAFGRTIERFNPLGTGTGGRMIPVVFANRRSDRGMAGLTITPDGQKLVGILESSMYNPYADRISIKSSSRISRILVFDIETGATLQYIYVQEAPGLSNSEIRAISNTEFLVLESDELYQGGPVEAEYKRIYRISLTGATDVSDPANNQNGLTVMVDGLEKTLEQLTVDELLAAGIIPVQKTLVFDLLSDMSGYAHDKPEGMSILDVGLLAVINDDDFGIEGDGNGGMVQKTLPRTGEVDRSTMYFVELGGDVLDVGKTARIQIVHNAGRGFIRSAPGMLDVYLNGRLLVENLAFLHASPYITVPAETRHSIAIVPAGVTDLSLSVNPEKDIVFSDEGTYVVTAIASFDRPTSIKDIGRYAGVKLITTELPVFLAGKTVTDGPKVFAVNGIADTLAIEIRFVGTDGTVTILTAEAGSATDLVALSADVYEVDLLVQNSGQRIGTYRLDLDGTKGPVVPVLISGIIQSDDESPVTDVQFTLIATDERIAETKDQGDTDVTAGLPTDFTLEGNYPNPFNPSTTIRYGIPLPTDVRLVVFDMLGREVAVLVDRRQEAGWFEVRFDAGRLASGLYVYRLDTGSVSRTATMMLTK